MRIEVLGPREAKDLTEELLSIWLRAFAQPPYYVRREELPRVRQMFSRHLSERGFRLAVVMEAQAVLGFGYGFLRRAGEPWTDAVARALRPLGLEWWLQGAFGLVEFAVDPQQQNLGLGSRLHDVLLAATDAPRAVLTVHRQAPALGFYQRRGWQRLGQLPASAYLILGKRLDPMAPSEPRPV